MKSFGGKVYIDPVIIGLSLFSIFFHLVFMNNLEYHRDELLYFSLGQHPAAGFDTVPPVIGLTAFVMIKLFGFSLFAVRFLPALLSGALIMLVASMSKELGGSRYASILASIGILVSTCFMRTFSLFMPVFIEVFLWTLCIYWIIRFINTQKDRYLIFFCINAGIAMLNKYLAALLFIGLLIIIPFTEYRYVFRKRAFYLGLGIAFLLFLPNLLWQASKGFPVFRHMSELYSTQLVHMDIPEFLNEQLLMPFMGTILTIASLIFLIFRKKAARFRFLGYLSLFVILSLMLLKGKGYYTLGIFPLLIVAGAVSYDHWLKRRWIRIAIPVLMVIITLPIVPMGIPIFNEEGLIAYFKRLQDHYGLDVGRRFEDGSIHSLPQDYADMLGWEELTQNAGKAYGMIRDKKSAFIYCENYGQAGAISVIGKKYGLPEAVCFSESFRYWIPGQFNPDIKSIVYINTEAPGDDVKWLFRKITRIGGITNPDAREFGTSVYLCEDPVESFNKFWTARISHLK
jgi:hypothetical protein